MKTAVIAAALLGTSAASDAWEEDAPAAAALLDTSAAAKSFMTKVRESFDRIPSMQMECYCPDTLSSSGIPEVYVDVDVLPGDGTDLRTVLNYEAWGNVKSLIILAECRDMFDWGERPLQEQVNACLDKKEGVSIMLSDATGWYTIGIGEGPMFRGTTSRIVVDRFDWDHFKTKCNPYRCTIEREGVFDASDLGVDFKVQPIDGSDDLPRLALNVESADEYADFITCRAITKCADLPQKRDGYGFLEDVLQVFGNALA